MDEFDALNDRILRVSAADVYEPVDHGLDIGEVALGSLKDAVESRPLAKGVISIIQELIAITKAIAKRVRAGW
ncbi:hypothetical protein XarzCFBP7410_15330 [Xanthomonas arboricola pv. zantedeschiae]|nr:hypothetical protein XarzCFBP7410_15330 [Xanthomonas arboricola pv. zantedeschiae]